MLVLNVAAPAANESASRADPTGGSVWSLEYDRQLSHLHEMERAAERLGLVGSFLVWFPRRWLRRQAG